MTYEEAKKRLESWREDNNVEISPELLECCYRALQKIKVGTWELHNYGEGTCSKCHFTQTSVWDNESWQRYCGVCGAEMIEIKTKL